MLLQLLAHTLKEPCFDKLRTKEQLGRAILSLLGFCSVIDLVIVRVCVCVCRVHRGQRSEEVSRRTRSTYLDPI